MQVRSDRPLHREASVHAANYLPFGSLTLVSGCPGLHGQHCQGAAEGSFCFTHTPWWPCTTSDHLIQAHSHILGLSRLDVQYRKQCIK